VPAAVTGAELALSSHSTSSCLCTMRCTQSPHCYQFIGSKIFSSLQAQLAKPAASCHHLTYGGDGDRPPVDAALNGQVRVGALRKAGSSGSSKILRTSGAAAAMRTAMPVDTASNRLLSCVFACFTQL
jgi:hypothetical protein